MLREADPVCASAWRRSMPFWRGGWGRRLIYRAPQRTVPPPPPPRMRHLGVPSTVTRPSPLLAMVAL
jgi:hypothetical protein